MTGDEVIYVSEVNPHFMLCPPSMFTPAATGILFTYERSAHQYQYSRSQFADPPHIVEWLGYRNVVVFGVGDRVDEVIETLHAFQAGGSSDVPLAYLLVSARLLSPGDVLCLLAKSTHVPTCAVSQYALDMMLGSYVVNHFGPKTPLIPARTLDVVGGGLDACIDSDPISEDLFLQIAQRTRETTFRMRARMQQTLFPGELPAAVLARFTNPAEFWRFNGYTRGTLRQVFAGILHGKQVVGAVPADRVRVGYHTDDDWA